jgi:hypothetical protein
MAMASSLSFYLLPHQLPCHWHRPIGPFSVIGACMYHSPVRIHVVQSKEREASMKHLRLAGKEIPQASLLLLNKGSFLSSLMTFSSRTVLVYMPSNSSWFVQNGASKMTGRRS